MSRHTRTGLRIGAAAVTLAVSAGAASPSPRERQNNVEDALADGDIDTEDFVSFRAPRPFALVGSRASAYVALSAFLTHGDAREERGGMLVLGLPFDRLFAPARPPVPARIAEQTPAAAPAPGPTPAPAAITISSVDARACVNAALRAAGLSDETRLESVAARARASAALPELRLRALRSVDQSGRLTYTELDPYRYSEAGATGYTFEARLTFHLDRLLFADEEVSIERMRIDRQDARTRVASKALSALFEWQRAYALGKNPTLSTEEHLSAVLREVEAGATLDVMTDGWFARWRAAADPALAGK
jgi:hypothetical protein